MKSTPTTAPAAPANTTGNPPISLVPPPTDAEQLAKANAEVEELRGLLGRIRKDYAELREKLRSLETNPLSFALSNIDAGAVLADAGEQLKNLCSTVLRREEKGVFTLKVVVKPFKDALVLTGEVKVVEPKPEAAPSIFYATEDGELQRHDPRQRSFDFSRGDRSPGGSDDEAYAEERRNPENR